MRNYLQKPSTKKIRFVIVLLFLSSAMLSPHNSWCQKKQLTKLGPVVKIAYLDHSALRKGYKELNDVKQKLANENAAAKKSFEQSLQLLDQQTSQLLKQDSLTGGKSRVQMLNDAASRRSKLTLDFEASQKKKNQDKNNLLQEYEKKITLAIEQVVNEGGFTDVQTLGKGTTISKGVNITDLVLKKLN